MRRFFAFFVSVALCGAVAFGGTLIGKQAIDKLLDWYNNVWCPEADYTGVLPDVPWANYEEVSYHLLNPWADEIQTPPDTFGKILNMVHRFIGWGGTSWITIYGEVKDREELGQRLLGFGTAWCAMTLGHYDYWVSAHHCSQDVTEDFIFQAYRIRGVVADLVYHDYKRNLSIWRTPHMKNVIALYNWFGLLSPTKHVTNDLRVGDWVFVPGWTVIAEPVDPTDKWGDYRWGLMRGTGYGYVISTLPAGMEYLSADFWAVTGVIPGYSGSPVLVYRDDGDGRVEITDDMWLVGVLNVGAGAYNGMTFVPVDLFDKIKELHRKLEGLELWEK